MSNVLGFGMKRLSAMRASTGVGGDGDASGSASPSVDPKFHCFSPSLANLWCQNSRRVILSSDSRLSTDVNLKPNWYHRRRGPIKGFARSTCFTAGLLVSSEVEMPVSAATWWLWDRCWIVGLKITRPSEGNKP